MGIFKALIKTAFSPVEIAARTVKNVGDNFSETNYDERFPIVGDGFKAIGDTFDGIVKEFDNDRN